MIPYAQVMASGEIRVIAFVDESACSALNTDPITGDVYVQVPKDIPIEQMLDSTVYVNGAFARVSKKPSHYYSFDSASMSWVDTRSIQEIKESKRREVNSFRSLHESGGFEWNSYIFDSDALSQQRIQGSVQLAQIVMSRGQEFSIDWTLADNSVVTLDGPQMIAVGLAMGEHIMLCHSKARLLRNQIELAQSKEELDSIVW